MTRTYEPLSAENLDWLRRYVERNPETTNGRHWGRFLTTLDEATTERDRLRNPAPGDIPSQAAAWVEIHRTLKELGLESFMDRLRGTGRQRAIKFVTHLAEKAKDKK